MCLCVRTCVRACVCVRVLYCTVLSFHVLFCAVLFLVAHCGCYICQKKTKNQSGQIPNPEKQDNNPRTSVEYVPWSLKSY